jgi:UDP-N-acetylmuramoylalanine--D-glutamate ligase
MNLLGKKVAVYGLGVSGVAVIKFLANKGLSSLVIVNSGPVENWVLPTLDESILVEKVREDVSSDIFASCDLIVLSPGIPREVDSLRKALDQKIPVWNEVELAYNFFDGDIIAVTGTNGKTTTVSFLNQLFLELGVKVFLGGNIGIPFVESLSCNDYEYAILELSSFQCESLESFRAKSNIILNVYDNHGERYDDMEYYRKAKWMMVKNTSPSDKIFVGSSAGSPPFSSIEGEITEVSEDWDNQFKKIFDITKMKVIGAHNRFNFYTAWLMYNSLGLPVDVFKKTLYSFLGVEHRVERLDCNSIIYNDAKSTNPLALLTAVTAVSECYDDIILIMGGRKRSELDYPNDDIIKKLENCCHKVLCIGEAAPGLIKLSNIFENVENLDKAKEYIVKNAKEKVVLFSPGYPSFDQYQNYAQRGNHFKQLFGEM